MPNSLGFGREVQTIGISGADNQRKFFQCWTLQSERVKESIKAALLSSMGEMHALNIKWNSAETIGNVGHILWRHIEYTRIRIDKTPDQPWASQSVDLGGAMARDPKAP